MYQRYVHEYGVPVGALAPLAINNRKNAALNSVAVMRDPIDVEAYMKSRFIAEPLRLLDYCLINDGGVAIILTTVKRAQKLGRPFAILAAASSSAELTNFYTSQDFFAASSEQVAERVYSTAGIGPQDVDVAQIYDNFTPTILFSLEGFGFCDRGTGWQWIRDGRIGLDGELPVNTSGGHTSESYMQGWAMYAEAVRQARGDAGARQVSDVTISQYICVSPITSSHILVGSS
jgi:acetyl-CoA acetyltransferase